MQPCMLCGQNRFIVRKARVYEVEAQITNYLVKKYEDPATVGSAWNHIKEVKGNFHSIHFCSECAKGTRIRVR